MTARRKALWRWEPSWYILVFVLLFIASALQAMQLTVGFVIALAVTIGVAAVFAVIFIVAAARGTGNPDASGALHSLQGITVIVVDPSDEPGLAVADTSRHKSAVDAAGAFGRNGLTAVLVPGVTRWLGLRLRVAVHLVAGERIFHVGFLPITPGDEWNTRLLPLRRANTYLRVPAVVLGARVPYRVEVDLAAARRALDSGNSQPATS